MQALYAKVKGQLGPQKWSGHDLTGLTVATGLSLSNPLALLSSKSLLALPICLCLLAENYVVSEHTSCVQDIPLVFCWIGRDLCICSFI